MPKPPKGAKIQYYAETGNDRTIEHPYAVFRTVDSEEPPRYYIEVWNGRKWSFEPFYWRYIHNGEVGADEITAEKAQALIESKAWE